MYPPKSYLPSTAVVFTMGRSHTPSLNTTGQSFDCADDYGVPVPGMNASANIQETVSAAGPVVIDKCLSRVFVAAYLLSGSAHHAEGIVLESIQQLDIQAVRSGCLSWKSIAAATLRGDPNSGEKLDEASALLPIELQRVLRLSPGLRQCFVLRVLMAMPRQYCAGLLRIDAEEVDVNSYLAARELASNPVG